MRLIIHVPMEHLEPKQAQEFLRDNADALFIDCRSEMEYLFVGHQRNMISGWRHSGLPWEQC